MPFKLLPFHQFELLPSYEQITHLNESAIALDVYYGCGNKEFVLFAYNDFYLELVVEKVTDEILEVRCFKTPNKLTPYLEEIDISEVTILLSPS